MARAIHHDRPLIDIRFRTRANRSFFATSSINSFNTLLYTLRIDAASGVAEEGETEEILPPADLETAGVLARLGELGVNFAGAIESAHLVTGRTDAELRRVALSSDSFMILYDIRYADDLRLVVDGVTGRVISQGEEARAVNAVLPSDVSAAFARAQSLAGPTWRPFDSEVLLTEQGAAWTFFFITPANARVKQVEFVGSTEVVHQYTPIGRLAERAAEVRAQLGTIVVTADGFLADIEANQPGALVAGVSLDSRTRDGEVRTRWSATLLTAQGGLVEYAVDATVPVGSGLRIVRLATPRAVGDLTGDGRVHADDLMIFFSTLGTDYPPCDFDRDGCVTGADLAFFLQNWG